MKRRDFMAVLAVAAAYPLGARAQQNKMPVIGALSSLSVALPWGPYRREAWSGFLKGLDDTGFFAATDIAFERRPSEAEQSVAAVDGQNEGLPAMAADLVRRKVDVIVAFGSAEARAAKSATATIPIVFESGDPIAEGLVSGLARPDGNLTGVTLADAELMPKRLQLLSELVPAVRVFALLVNPNATNAAAVTGRRWPYRRLRPVLLYRRR
jgi:putative ABC transport system substrate-binding protein